MREILFRGKRVDNGKWVYGFYVRLNGKEHRIYNGYAETDCGDYYPDCFSVDPSTVGQFTGLVDKNGRKIFEGDIVRLFDISAGEIVQECGAFGIGCRKQIDYDYLASEIAPVTGSNNTPMFCYNDNFVSLLELWWNYNEEGDEISVIEVIGNIHDNPEMLEVAK